MNIVALGMLIAGSCSIQCRAALILEPPAIEWQRVYGTASFHERFSAMAPTADGGVLLGGVTTDLNDGFQNWWIVRVDALGHEMWRRTLGGSGEENLASMAQTRDGGFILGGVSFSPADGTKTSPFRGGLGDCWLVRLDADGNQQWDRSYGGSGREKLEAIRETMDGGFVFAGSSTSTNGLKQSPYHGGFEDGWIVRLDAVGDVVWEQSFGGEGDEAIRDVRATPDGGFVAVGYSDSPTNAIKSGAAFGDRDFWILRLDAQGQKLWDRTYGGTFRDSPSVVQAMPDGGYVVGGTTASGAGGNKLLTNYAAAPYFGSSDFWLLRLDAEGVRIWEAEFGGRSEDVLLDLQRTRDGGFLLGGHTLSGEGGTKTSVSRGGFDYWVVRTDASGQALWDESYGGNENDRLGALHPTPAGGFLLGGYSLSGVRGNKTVSNYFGEDFWVLKLAPDALTTRPHLRWEPCCEDDLPGYRLLLRGSSNLTYGVEYSTNLFHWTSLREVRATGTEVEVFSSSPLFQPVRFFRAVLVP